MDLNIGANGVSSIYHIDIDIETLQIRAVQLTTNDVSDSQVLEDLLALIPQDEQIDSVYTDGLMIPSNTVMSLQIGKHMQ